jgi:endonuclease-3
MDDLADTGIGHALQDAYPDARCELLARDPWELLVAVILSARTTDVQVNKVMAVLNEHYVGPQAIADLDHRELDRVIRHVPLHRQKSRAIVEAARAILRLHHGQVPRTMPELSALPGVGRKTAAVVMGNAFGVPAVAADVHVQRVAHRLGWARREHPADAEVAVVRRFPPEQWVRICHQFIRLGRDCCRRMKPRCERCPVSRFCVRQGIDATTGQGTGPSGQDG